MDFITYDVGTYTHTHTHTHTAIQMLILTKANALYLIKKIGTTDYKQYY